MNGLRDGVLFSNGILGSAFEPLSESKRDDATARFFCNVVFLMGFLAGCHVLPTHRSILSPPRAMVTLYGQTAT